MNEQQQSLIARLRQTQDGRDFVGEILEVMYKQNYEDILKGNRTVRDELVGFGCCLKTLLDAFANSKEPIDGQKDVVPDRY